MDQSTCHSGYDITQNLSIDFTKQVACRGCKGALHMIMLSKYIHTHVIDGWTILETRDMCRNLCFHFVLDLCQMKHYHG